jgi:hypothetical protein
LTGAHWQDVTGLQGSRVVVVVVDVDVELVDVELVDVELVDVELLLDVVELVGPSLVDVVEELLVVRLSSIVVDVVELDDWVVVV